VDGTARRGRLGWVRDGELDLDAAVDESDPLAVTSAGLPGLPGAEVEVEHPRAANIETITTAKPIKWYQQRSLTSVM
jgi:hypothetical protein